MRNKNLNFNETYWICFSPQMGLLILLHFLAVLQQRPDVCVNAEKTPTKKRNGDGGKERKEKSP